MNKRGQKNIMPKKSDKFLNCVNNHRRQTKFNDDNSCFPNLNHIVFPEQETEIDDTLLLPFELEKALDILISDDELEKSVLAIAETIVQVEEDEKKEYLTLTEKIQINWSPEISQLCHNAKNVYNFGNFVMRKLFFLKNKNPNCSWDDFLTIRQSILPDSSVKNYNEKRGVLLNAFDSLKNGIQFKSGKTIKNSLNTLLKFNKFFTSTGYAQISQQILQVLSSNWLTYFTNINLFYKGELDNKPQIPGFIDPDGEFMVIYPGQLMKKRNDFENHIEQTKRIVKYQNYSKTTSEMLFPKRHETIFRFIRVRYEILQNLREVRVIPHGNYYEIEIRYYKQIENLGLCQKNALSIDLGQKNPLAIVNNIGLKPILIHGNELKRANYIINKESPKHRSIQGVYRDILKKSKKSKLPILQIVQDKNKKYLNECQWKQKVAQTIINHPTMTYNEFRNLYGGRKKFMNLFHYLKDLPNTKAISDYFFYEKNELNRKQHLCYNLNKYLNGKSENTHVQCVKDLQQQNQTIIDRLFKIYRNKTHDATHKITRFVLNYCKYFNFGIIVIGYNEGWKTRSKLSKSVNRKFIPLPFYKIIESIKYKAILCGINVIVQEESYTSKCSALDYEPIEFHINYAGIRGPSIRGKDGKPHKHYEQFYSNISRKFIHADINGAFNIGRKGVPLLFDGIPSSNKNKKHWLFYFG